MLTMTYAITVTLCKGRPPSVHIRDLPNVDAAMEFALSEWPQAVRVDVKPVRVINLETHDAP